MYMNFNYRFIISWLLVILWMFNIYYLSSMDSELSNTKSNDTINTVVESSVVYLKIILIVFLWVTCKG